MTSSSRFGSNWLSKSRKRRPAGISRRRKKQLTLETLEDRRMMAGDASLFVTTTGDTYELVSYSNNTPEGAAAIQLAEYMRYAANSGAAIPEYTLNSIPTDPLVNNQWHLINTAQQVGNPDYQNIFGTAGEDINVAPVWNQGYTGEGVVVAVFDSGVELTHPDLAANIDPTFQLDAIDFDGDASPEIFAPPIPELNDPTNAHGTAVAGIIASVADNGIGGAGVAPNAQIVPVRIIDVGQTEQGFIDAFRYRTSEIDIANHSWGPAVTRGLAGPTANELLAVRDSIFFGRPDAQGNALGVIHVFAAGNSAEAAATSSYNGWVNSRYTIGVTGVDHDGFYNNIDGTVTGYPETGASVLVAAPTGSVALSVVNDTGNGSGIITTDITGDLGYNISPDPDDGQEFDRDFLDDEDYTSRFNGTSAATPMVSGVIALMLEANPNLHWRDVQEILIRSARQNAEFGEPANGADKTFNVAFPNTWIQNQVPLFHDPDPWDITISPALQVYTPTLDPNLTAALSPDRASGGHGAFAGGLQNHYAAAPLTMTNGAGYTISQGVGTNGEQIGYAHGVVDAELAVSMAEQWHAKEQALPDELTFTTAVNLFNNGLVPSAEKTAENRGDYVVPGGLGGLPGFVDYYQEYFEPDNQFQPNEMPALLGQPRTGGPLEFEVPDEVAMSVENIEVSITFGDSAQAAAALEHLRIVLVSPNGTHSELNHFYVDGSFIDDIVQIDAGVSRENLSPVYYGPNTAFDTGVTTHTFSTNRSWGERSDNNIIIDPLTNEPIVDTLIGGDAVYNSGEDLILGDVIQQGWQLHFENWGLTDINIPNIEVAWHGSPINPNTQRVQGLIGIDENRDNAFNYSRIVEDNALDADPTIRLGEVANAVDDTHEKMAADVTVFAHRDVNSNGVLDGPDILVDQFVTGHDGNYYFDLLPNDYIISVDDGTLGGATAIDDTLTAAGFLQDYQAQWAISTEFFQVWDYDANLDVPINPLTDAPFAFLDGNSLATTSGMRHINFLLDPGDAPTEVEFSGTVFADINGNGSFDGTDVALPGQFVYGDSNRNGSLDSGEAFTTTDQNGDYSLLVPAEMATVLSVGVITPSNWSTSSPTSGFVEVFAAPGDLIDNVDFYMQPPSSTSPGNGAANSGIVLGNVFLDEDEDGFQDLTEDGAQGITVYIDLNNNGVLDLNEDSTVTNANGGYALTGLSNGNYLVRLDLEPGSLLQQSFPLANSPQGVAIVSGGTAPGVRFGITGGATFDYGDLPEAYGPITRLEDNGARHTVGNYYLGQSVDAEVNAVILSGTAQGDDLNLLADEDGVVLVGGALDPGTTATFEVTASLFGGYLQAWMDFNNDGDFDDVVDGISERVVEDLIVAKGLNQISVPIPASVSSSSVYARFRYGEFGLELTGPAVVGEVEDYELDVLTPEPPPGPVTVVNDSDFDDDGMVTGLDFLRLQRGIGTSPNAINQDGDANDDGNVDYIDVAYWEIEFGEYATASAAPPAPLVVQEPLGDPLGSSSTTTLATEQVPVAASPAVEPVIVATANSNAPVATEIASVVEAAQPLGLPASSSPQTKAPISPVDSGNIDTDLSASIRTSVFDSEVDRLFRGSHRLERREIGLARPTRVENELQEEFDNQLSAFDDFEESGADDAIDVLFGRIDRDAEEIPRRRELSSRGRTVEAVGRAMEELRSWRLR